MNLHTHSICVCVFVWIYRCNRVLRGELGISSVYTVEINFPLSSIKTLSHQYVHRMCIICRDGIIVQITWWNSLWCWTAPTSPPIGSCSDSSSSLAVSHSMISCRESCSFPLLSEKASSRTLPTHTQTHTRLVKQTVL